MINDDEEWVITCTECRSDNRVDPERDLWIQSGYLPPCKFCGGVTILIGDRRQRDAALRTSEVQRGIYSEGG